MTNFSDTPPPDAQDAVRAIVHPPDWRNAELRAHFAAANHGVWFLDASDVRCLEAYLLHRRLAARTELPIRVESAGDGNMNLTLRVSLRDRSLILKQGRPWVERYDHIPAPWDRTLIEAEFYAVAASALAVSARLPGLLDVDAGNHVIALEDLGRGGDVASIYGGDRLNTSTVHELLNWLAALPTVDVPSRSRGVLANREMRALNHEHLFRFPLDEHNGLGLDAITPGLGTLARELQQDRRYQSRVTEIGARYLTDGRSLVHGDFFPGSWIRTDDAVRIIDLEFCFLGAREFDYGIMLGHIALARQDEELAERVLAAAVAERLDEALVLGVAGTEIMRRLIGVAQLPLTWGLDAKRSLLRFSRQLVLEPELRLASW
ncbi:MAG: phosphotransferase [Vicinamibacterales bacterium]